ncbi:Peroxisome biosynthesis protein pex1 [Rhizopus stolonifer]|uniref:Peroxisomal ATPase PEX1 n=1 Tax=Rhizopus stolonifer TaxID=4846 RepID=A0A367KK83_RHIST|nr:Peroxisome biosynthesis protein pex1 [Rhizopus stolonifer]
MPKPLIVQYTPIRSCLVNLPNKWVNALLDQKKVPQNVILEISSGDNKKVYCGWSGEASKPLQPNSVFIHGANGKLDVLELDPQLGTALGLQEGQKVQVEFCRNVPECTTVHVEPLTEDDWEILELHAGYVEENLLSQLRVVYTHQTICVWIHGKTLVRLAVASIEPKQDYVKLTNQSEVIVAPKVRKSNQPVEEVSELNNQAIIQKTQPSVRLRACSVQLEMDSLSVHVHPDSIESLLNSNGDMPSVIRLTKLLPGFSKSNKEEQQESDNDQYSPVKAVFARLYVSLSVPLNHVVIGSILKSTLEIKDFDIVKVATTTIKKSPLGSLVLKRCVNNSNNNNTIKLGLDNTQTQQKLNFEASVTKSIQTWLSQFTQDVVLSQGLLIDLEVDNKKEQFVTQLDAKKGFFGSNTASGEIEYTTLVPQQSVSIGFGEQVQKQPTKQNQSKPVIALGGVDTMLRKMEQYALANLSKRDLKYSLSVPGSGGVLVTGAHGSGKTSVVKHILNFCHNYHIYTIEINCSEIADERIPVFKEMLQKWFDEAAWHGPSVIFFDDLDRLVPAEVEHADSTRSRHLAELFVQTARIACQRHSIMLIATSQQQQSIHPALITHHIFSELKHLQPPNRDERKQIIQTIMSHGPSVLSSSLPSIDLVMVASETEGFLATDLKALIERTVHEGAIRSIKDNNREETEKKELKLIQADFTQAREGFVPSSLRGVKLQSSGVNWSDIGGLNETRKALLETLEWPTKYAAVFAQCPLRLRSGLLLYGYPGCGKTLLASAVAKECGLNFISVKGPEILNKYIGASEKSVRDLFERAQAAKPCVLFFDEFDSIAPRRGHDSTGVTDRVVNQMLTQMDGAEGLNGVYVLAATSRPDLIDPALLRPGRLDKALLCGMPSFEERLEILEALSSKMQLAPDVDLKIYAEKTQGFSGADLQGFLYNAHLEAIHGTIDIESFKEAQDVKSKVTEKSDFVMNARQAPLTLAEKGQISQRLAMIKNRKSSQTKVITETVTNQPQEAVITTSYLEKSFKSTRPSITAEEAYRLGLIYNEFVTGRTGELPSGEGAKGIGKRSTLG